LLTLPCGTLKGWMYLNVLPYWLDSAPRYQFVNTVFTSTVRSVVWRLLPVKWKVAWVRSRGVEYPVTCTSKPEVVRFMIATFVMVGTLRAIRIEALGAGDGVTSTLPARRLAVTVMVPAVVPVENWLAVASVPSAGIVKFAALLPSGNATA